MQDTDENFVDISIVIPCYNEEENLRKGVLDEVNDYFLKQSYTWEIIIVNDESSDDSRTYIGNFIDGKSNFHVMDIPHGGKAKALWAGLQETRGKMVLITDMDQSAPIQEIEKLLTWIKKDYDVVIGSRGSKREGFSILRIIGSFVFRNFRRFLILRKIIDTQCGFKLFKRSIALEFFPKLEIIKQSSNPTGWNVTAFDVELLYIIEKSGYKIKEVFIEWENQDLSTGKQQSRFNKYFKESVDMVSQIIRVKINHFLNRYK